MTENNIENIGTENNIEEENSFDFRTILVTFLVNWQWFALSVFIFICGAIMFIRYKSPVYQVSAKMLIKDEKSSRGGANQMLLANMQAFVGFMPQSSSTNINNELEILQSNSLSTQAVKNLKLYVEYKTYDMIKNRLIYQKQPINVDLDAKSLTKMDCLDKPAPIYLKIEKREGQYIVEGYSFDENNDKVKFNTSFNNMPYVYKSPYGMITFTKNTNVKALPMEKPEFVTITSPRITGMQYAENMEIELAGKMTTIAEITLKDKEFHRAKDFLKELAFVYNEYINEDKNEIAIKTEEFINGRLKKIDAELNTTESELENYKRHHNITEPKLDATQTLTQTSEYSTKLTEAKAQIQLMDYLRQYIDNPANKYQIIPSNIGLEDEASTSLIDQFNKNVLDRTRLLRAASEISPQVQALTATLDELRPSIKEALSQARQGATIRLRNIENQYTMYQNRVVNAPEQERILTQIGRQREVKAGIYLMLLQKREENSIQLSSTVDKGKLIDEPLYEKASPKGTIILLAAIVLGFGFPFLVIYVLQLIRYKIEGHDDIEKITNLPIIADIPMASNKAKNDSDIVVKENKNTQIDEVYRSLRTNIQFMLKGNEKVILFTSSTSGEGKTFSAANLAASLAFLDKRVVILDLDLRKPALSKIFKVSDISGGISSLLAKNAVTKEDVIRQLRTSGVNKNLEMIIAGSVPPNPAELLARKNLADIINFLKEDFDYIILDTTIVGLVTDTLHIGKYTDITVFTCRADYTQKNSIKMFEELAKENKMPNCCIVLNGIDMSKKKNEYYYGYGKYGSSGNNVIQDDSIKR